MDSGISASCKCGKTQLKTKTQPILQLCCHCADCRNATGDDASTIVFFKRDRVQVSGDQLSQNFTSALGKETRRLACAQCAQVMFDISAGFPHMLGVIGQRIAPPFVAEPKIHVWVQSKLDQVILPKGVKIFKQGLS